MTILKFLACWLLITVIMSVFAGLIYLWSLLVAILPPVGAVFLLIITFGFVMALWLFLEDKNY